MGKQPYELSVWRDIFVSDNTQLADSYYTDEKVAVIGSDSMDSPLKAYDVTLKELTNGDCTLTFSMIYDYEKDGERVNNPLFELLKNEIKLKLRRGEEYGFIDVDGSIDFSLLEKEDTENRWRDFVIKTIDKDSTSHVANIVAKEVYVNELGKNGWSVTLNTELENNYGTVEQLAEKVLDGSDWAVEEGYSPIEAVQEPLFAFTVPQNMSIAADGIKNGKEKVTIGAGQIIYFFYNDVEFIEEGDGYWQVKENDSVQILWNNAEALPVDDNRVVVDDEFSFNYKIASAAVNVQPTGYSGNRIQDRARTIYESTLDKYVEVYTNGTDEYYSYTETEYNVSPLVQNYLTNSTNFTSNAGWKNLNIANEDPIITIYPPIKEENGQIIWEESNNTLILKGGESYKNSGPTNAGLKVVKGETYVVRFSGEWVGNEGDYNFKIKDRDNINTDFASTNAETEFLTRKVEITLEDSTIITKEDEGYLYCKIKIDNSSTSKQSLIFTISTTADYYLYDIQLFKYQEEDGVVIFPGDEPKSSIEEKRYFYQVGETTKEITYYDGSNLIPVHEDGYESVRFFETQESNYFNNIQSLAELFEVWVSFNIKHKKNGQIWLDDNNKPVKTVKFHQYSPTGKDNYAGFKYGINLKNIKRTVDSNSIASKVIVKPNNQEYATDGMCSIARAPSNQTGETEILNFDYYINQGLLDYNQVLNDFYGTSSTHLRFFPKLKKLNEDINKEATLVNAYSNTIAELEAQWDLYNAEILSYDNEISELISYYSNLNDEDEKKQQYANEIARLEILRNVAKQNRDNIEDDDGNGSLKVYKELIYGNGTEENIGAQKRMENFQVEKEKLKLQFYTKYSRFIQEGTWTDESYVDDELYYLDAVKISNTSAYPQVSYTINVLSIEDVDGYEAYKFNVGDRTYIEDVEFFGYVIKEFNGMSKKTPYRMEVIVSERNQNLDDASKTTITIKNYKNQFEELFQKITATTQSLQYQVGEYARAAGVITPTGEIKVSTLEQSFQNNSLILSGSDNQSVIWDTGTGIEVIDNRSSNNRVRVVGGGVFISSDGGVTWSNAISGNGINTKYLIAGQIDASKINIVNGSVPYFRWDTNGITAFKVDSVIKDGQITGETYDTNRYVRFNQYGIYAVGAGSPIINGSINGSDLDKLIANESTLDKKLEVIEKNASFALTWKGLSLVASGGDYSEWQAVKLDAGQGLRLINEEYSFKATAEEIANETDILKQMPYYFARFGKGEGTSYEYTGDNRFFPILAVGQFPDMPCTPYEKKDDLGNTITIKKEPVYGLRLRNREGYVTLTTDNRGELWVQDRIFVGPWGNLYDSSKLSTTVGLNAKIISEEEFKNLENALSKLEPAAEEITNDYLSERSIRIWSGAENLKISSSPFLILENGTLIAEKAYIKGNIQADSGNISGLLTIGDGRHGINGSAIENGYILWGGKSEENEEINYQFSVDYTGKLHAKNADISGSIIAESGIIKELLIPDQRAGITSEGEVILWIHENNSLNSKTDSNFYVTNTGDLYASNIYLKKSILIGEDSKEDTITDENGNSIVVTNTYYKAGINYLENSTDIKNNNDLAFWAGAKNNNYKNSAFSVGLDGKVIANSINLEDGSLIANNASLEGKLLVGKGKENYIIIDNDNGISTSNFNSAYGWKIDMKGDAYFSNINARGEIVSATFTYNSVNTMGGDLYIAPTYYDYNNTTILINQAPLIFKIKVDKETFDRDIWGNKIYLLEEKENEIVIKFEDKINIYPFNSELNEYVNIKFNFISTEEYSTEYNNNEGRLFKVTDNINYYFYIYYYPQNLENLDSNEIPKIANTYGKISNFSIALITGCGINLTAGHILGPAIIITDISKDGQVITQLGRLSGIQDDIFTEPLEGYGLYGQNVYLTGKVYLPNAGITNDEEEYNGENKISSGEGQQIRMWAGSVPKEKSTAPFVVTQDGSLYASKGIFSGIIQATNSTFSGWLQTTGILIDDNQKTYELDEIYIEETNKKYFLIKKVNDSLTIEELINNYLIEINESIIKINETPIEKIKDLASQLPHNTIVYTTNYTIIIVKNNNIYSFSDLKNETSNLFDFDITFFNTINSTEYKNSNDIPENLKNKLVLYYKEENEIYCKYIKTFLTKYQLDINDFNKYNGTNYNYDDILTEKLIFNIGEDRKSPESVFYVAYDKDDIDKTPKNRDKILQIDKDGLSIWEGGLNVYSDYATGWRNDLQIEPSKEFLENYYGYNNELTKENPFPYIKAIDAENYRLYSTGLNIGKFENNKTIPFVQINNGHISFVRYNNTNTDNEIISFEKLEKEAFNTEPDWYISDTEGILNIGNKFKEKENNLVTFERNNDEVKLGVKGKIRVDDEIDTLNYLNFITETDEVVVQIKRYYNENVEFDRGIDFVI